MTRSASMRPRAVGLGREGPVVVALGVRLLELDLEGARSELAQPGVWVAVARRSCRPRTCGRRPAPGGPVRGRRPQRSTAPGSWPWSRARGPRRGSRPAAPGGRGRGHRRPGRARAARNPSHRSARSSGPFHSVTEKAPTWPPGRHSSDVPAEIDRPPEPVGRARSSRRGAQQHVRGIGGQPGEGRVDGQTELPRPRPSLRRLRPRSSRPTRRPVSNESSTRLRLSRSRTIAAQSRAAASA